VPATGPSLSSQPGLTVIQLVSKPDPCLAGITVAVNPPRKVEKLEKTSPERSEHSDDLERRDRKESQTFILKSTDEQG
jgi:hypothetical protein